MTLPPQAYTRDILIKAYEWLRDQPLAVREKALDADTLVGLYMHSRRRTSQDSWEQKVTTETFKNDLRHLAEDLKQFETPAPVTTSPPHASPPQRAQPVGIHSHSASFVPPVSTMAAAQTKTSSQVYTHTYVPPNQQAQSPQVQHHQTVTQQHTKAVSMSHIIEQPMTVVSGPNPPGNFLQLDERSLNMVREVQERFNLSSEAEAMRMLLVLGHEKLHSLLR